MEDLTQMVDMEHLVEVQAVLVYLELEVHMAQMEELELIHTLHG